jgi:hypothetical protein
MTEKEKIDEALKKHLMDNPSAYSSLQIIFFLAKHGANKGYMNEIKKGLHYNGVPKEIAQEIWAGKLLKEIQSLVAEAEKAHSQEFPSTVFRPSNLN